MQEYFPAPERRYPSPSAQRRSGEHWKARFGLAMVVLLTLASAAIMFRLAGLGVGAAASPFRGPQTSAARPTTAAPPANPAGQPAAPAAAATTAAAPAAPAAASTAAGAPAAPAGPSPTARPGREYTVQGGDTLFAIAQRNNTTVEALVAANNLRSRDVTLSIGQKLVIP